MLLNINNLCYIINIKKLNFNKKDANFMPSLYSCTKYDEKYFNRGRKKEIDSYLKERVIVNQNKFGYVVLSFHKRSKNIDRLFCRLETYFYLRCHTKILPKILMYGYADKNKESVVDYQHLNAVRNMFKRAHVEFSYDPIGLMQSSKKFNNEYVVINKILSLFFRKLDFKLIESQLFTVL